MAKYRANLPQLTGKLFLTDGGLETTLIFHDGIELPHFAAFDLLQSDSGRSALVSYFGAYARLARDFNCGLILESATWRASADWGEKLGYSPERLADANRAAIALLVEIREEFASDQSPMVISGCVGPRGDGYSSETVMTASEAEAYHAQQIGVFAETEADLITAITMTNVPEALGVTRAAVARDLPVVISFTVETDGRLPSGATLAEAITEIDAATDSAPAYYMINCAHPTHFAGALVEGQGWVERIRGLRANASSKSHAELDEATELDSGNPAELGAQYADLRSTLTRLNVLGGCCGTDHRHVHAIAEAFTNRQ